LLNDQNGFGYNVEISTLHGLTWRADGHDVNAGQKNGFTIIAVEPALQWDFSQNWLVAVVVSLPLQARMPSMPSIRICPSSGCVTNA
jgi:hypothetical protein